jgi:hypothetical protein
VTVDPRDVTVVGGGGGGRDERRGGRHGEGEGGVGVETPLDGVVLDAQVEVHIEVHVEDDEEDEQCEQELANR